MIKISKYLGEVLQAAVSAAIPAYQGDAAIQQEKGDEFDYSSPTAMKIYNSAKKQGSYGFDTCQDLAQAIAEKIPENELIENLTLTPVGSNHFCNSFP